MAPFVHDAISTIPADPEIADIGGVTTGNWNEDHVLTEGPVGAAMIRDATPRGWHMGVVPISGGGTGFSTLAEAQEALGVVPPPFGLAVGGTGGTSAPTARAALDVPSRAEAVLHSLAFIKGNLLAAAGPGEWVVVPPSGNVGDVLVADPAQPVGLKWAPADVLIGPPGPAGPAGATGPQGPMGPAGPAGQGIPTGGTSGQVLSKLSNIDYDTTWVTPASGGGGAPTSSQYVVLALDAALTGERRLQVGTRLSLADGGAGGDVTLDVSNPMPGTFRHSGDLVLDLGLYLGNAKPFAARNAADSADILLLYANASDTIILGNGVRPVTIDSPTIVLASPLAMAYGGVPAGGAIGQVLSKASAADRDLAWTTPSGGGLTNNSVTNAFLRDSAAYSVIGRSAGTAGDPADIAAGAIWHVLRRDGTGVSFGTLDLSQSGLTIGSLPAAKGGTGLTAVPPVGAGLRSTGTVYEASQLWPVPKMTALDQAAWTWLNQGAWTVAQGGGVVSFTQTATTGENIRGRYKAMAGQTQFIAGISPSAFLALDFMAMGIGLRNTAGKIAMIYLISGLSTLAFQARRNASPTSNTSSTAATGNMKTICGPIFLKIEWDGQFYQFSLSTDGVNFTIHLPWEDGNSGFFAGALPTQVGVFGFNNNGSGVPGGSSIISWVEV